MENDMEPPLSIGTVLKSRYEVTAPLGKGGISSVFRAVDRITCQTVAIKVIREDKETLRKKPLSLSRHPLGIEYSLLSRLSHRQLPSVSDLFVEGDYVCMVMEFIEGQTLSEMMDSLLCTDFTAIFRIFYQVLGTLSFLNRQKIIYRDLKPSNIIIVQQKIVKLVDFGAARRYSRFKKVTRYRWEQWALHLRNITDTDRLTSAQKYTLQGRFSITSLQGVTRLIRLSACKSRHSAIPPSHPDWQI